MRLPNVNARALLIALFLVMAPAFRSLASPDLQWTIEAIRHVTPAAYIDAPPAHNGFLDGYVRTPAHDWKFGMFTNAKTSVPGEIYIGRYENDRVARRALEKVINLRPLVLPTEHDPVPVDFIVATKSAMFVQDDDVVFVLQVKHSIASIASTLRDAILKETVAVVKQARAAIGAAEVVPSARPEKVELVPPPDRTFGQSSEPSGKVELPANAATPKGTQSKPAVAVAAVADDRWAWIVGGMLALVVLLVLARSRLHSSGHRRE